MYVYRFIDKDSKIIYIGKAKSIRARLCCHEHLPEKCYDEVDQIEYSKLNNNDESSIYERYLINKHSPKYNKEFNNNSDFRFELPDLEWYIYDSRKFKAKSRNHPIITKAISKYSDIDKEKCFKFCLDNIYTPKDTSDIIIKLMNIGIFDNLRIIDRNRSDLFSNSFLNNMRISSCNIVGYEDILQLTDGKQGISISAPSLIFFENESINVTDFNIKFMPDTTLTFSLTDELLYKVLSTIKKSGLESFNMDDYKYDYTSNILNYLDEPTCIVKSYRNSLIKKSTILNALL